MENGILQQSTEIGGFIEMIAQRVAEIVTDKMLPEMKQYLADDTISEKAAIAMLGCSTATLYRWKAEGKVTPIGKIGDKTYYSRSEIVRKIKSNNKTY